MRVGSWLRRLTDELPGWTVWHNSAPPCWEAVPAPAGTAMPEAVELPGRVRADSPQSLRRLCQERYGWNDSCDSCGVPARECGHFHQERDTRRLDNLKYCDTTED